MGGGPGGTFLLKREKSQRKENEDGPVFTAEPQKLDRNWTDNIISPFRRVYVIGDGVAIWFSGESEKKESLSLSEMGVTM